MKFPVVLHKDEGTDYGVTIPDVPGCFSAGATAAEALESAREALALHFEGLLADGEAIPLAREIDAHMSNPDYAGGVWAVVDFDVTPYLGKSARYNITLPKALVERIDRRVSTDPRYGSRSAFLAAAALRELGRLAQPCSEHPAMSEAPAAANLNAPTSPQTPH